MFSSDDYLYDDGQHFFLETHAAVPWLPVTLATLKTTQMSKFPPPKQMMTQ